jgi:hypothetical protein
LFIGGESGNKNRFNKSAKKNIKEVDRNNSHNTNINKLFRFLNLIGSNGLSYLLTRIFANSLGHHVEENDDAD